MPRLPPCPPRADWGQVAARRLTSVVRREVQHRVSGGRALLRRLPVATFAWTLVELAHESLIECFVAVELGAVVRRDRAHGTRLAPDECLASRFQPAAYGA